MTGGNIVVAQAAISDSTTDKTRTLGMLLVLMFAQQVIFGGFEQLLSLFTLTRLGMNGAGNAALFIFVGFIIVMVQGRLACRICPQ